MKHELKYTAIYMDYSNTLMPYTIRICPIQTSRFSHGLPIDIVRNTEVGIIEACKEVDAYIDSIIQDKIKYLLWNRNRKNI